MKTRVIKLLAALLAVSSGSAFAAPSLDATGSGFDGLSPSSGPFGRTNLTPLTTVDPNGGLKVSISANGQRIQPVDASHSFDFVATLRQWHCQFRQPRRFFLVSASGEARVHRYSVRHRL